MAFQNWRPFGRKNKLTQLIAAALFAFPAIAVPAAIETRAQTATDTPLVKCWEVEIGSSLAAGPAVTGGTVFLAEDPGRLTALDGATGNAIWTSELGGRVVSEMIVLGDRLYVVSNPVTSEGTTAPSIIRSLNPSSGLTIASFELPRAEAFHLGAAGARLVVIASDGAITAFDGDLGKPVWTHAGGGEYAAAPSVNESFVAIVTGTGTLSVLDAATGSVRLERKLEPGASALALVGDSAVAIGDRRGRLTIYGIGDGSLWWRFKSGAAVSRIAYAGDRLAVSSLDNFVYLMKAAGGDVVWRKRLQGRALVSPLIIGDRVFTAVYGESVLVVSDLASARTVNRFDLGEGRYAVHPLQDSGGRRLIASLPGSILAIGLGSCDPK